MGLEQDLYTRLTMNAGVKALVATRVYPLAAPQDAAMPNLAYQRISGVPDLAHNGATGIMRARVQITCMASTYAGVKALSDAVEAALHGWKGGSVGAAIIDNERDDYSSLFVASIARLDVILWYG